MDERVAAIVVNYNAGDYVVECVRTLRAAGVKQVIVADNASTDGSVEALRADDADVTIVETGGGLGYGANANRGVAVVAEATEILVICNSDLTVEANAIKALVAALDDDAELGIVGPRIDNVDGTLYPSARVVPRLLDAAGHAFLGLVMPNNRFTRRYRLLDWDHKTTRRVDWVSGACFAIRRSLFERIGGFDEAYFMYLEDIDLCHRAGATGAAVGYEPAAQVVHVGGVSTRQLPYRMMAAHHRSVLRWWLSNNRGPRRVLFPLVAGGLGVRFVIAAAVRLIRR